MAYFKIDDYTLRISKPYLDQILDQATELSGYTADQVLEDAQDTAIAEISAYLTSRYVIEDEFAKDATADPDNRNKMILKCGLDMAIYFIHWTINPRDVPELREKAYLSCREMLAAFRDGELLLLQPPSTGGVEIRTEEDGGDKRTELNSQIKFISKPYSDPANTDMLP